MLLRRVEGTISVPLTRVPRKSWSVGGGIGFPKDVLRWGTWDSVDHAVQARRPPLFLTE
jgi:hypothetical protein